MKLPALPKRVFSLLGPVSVEKTSLMRDKELLGQVRYDKRSIKIDDDMTPTVEWMVLFHEITHTALFDTGAAAQLTEAQTEVVCDAIALYLTKALEAGSLRIDQARPRARSK